MSSSKNKRSETLSIRITPELKEALFIISNIKNCSIASVIADHLDEGFSKTEIPISIIGNLFKRKLLNDWGESIPLREIVKICQAQNPIISQLRLYYLAPQGLSEKQRIISKTILDNIIFEGDDFIFDDHDNDFDETICIDLRKVEEHKETLSSYADFLFHNSQRKGGGFPVNYTTYLKLKNDGVSNTDDTRKPTN